MENIDNMTDHQRRQLLDALMHHLTPETRRKVMREVPQAYNAYCGREIVHVTTPTDRGE